MSETDATRQPTCGCIEGRVRCPELERIREGAAFAFATGRMDDWRRLCREHAAHLTAMAVVKEPFTTGGPR